MCVLAFAEGVEKKSIINDDLKKQSEQLKSAMQRANEANEQRKAKEEELKTHILALEKIGAGVNERMNWHLLHQYINRASPQPNGERLTKEGQGDIGRNVWLKLWNNNKDAKQAYEDWEKLRLGEYKDLPPDKAFELDRSIKRNLIQINIAGINALYTNDLGLYFRKIGKEVALQGMTEAEQGHIRELVKIEEADADKLKASPLFKHGKDGWVVEIRGYTYHHGGFSFVNETIMQNLQFPAELKDAKDPELAERWPKQN